MSNAQKVSLDFIGFQGRQDRKTIDYKITPSDLNVNCPHSLP